MIVNLLLPLYMKSHFPEFDMKMQGIVISGWQMTFAFFSPAVVCLQKKLGYKNTLIYSIILKLIAAVGFGLISFVTNGKAFWILNFAARLIEGMGDTATIISYTTIISSEFPEKADYYYSLMHLAWSASYLIGPIVTYIAYDTFGYCGTFLFTAFLIGSGALIPAILMLPSRLN